MANKRIHEIVGKITSKKLHKVYRKNSPYFGNNFYRLTIKSEEQEKELLVFKDKLENETILSTIEQSEYIDKRYLFYYSQNQNGKCRLVNWKDLPPFPLQEKASLENHEKN